MKREMYWMAGGLGALALLGCQAPQKAVQYPNVIYVFPDQFRNHAMGFWNEEGFADQVNFRGDPVYTPNLNRFAREAVVLTSAQSNCPLSSPHRGMLLTGQYPDGSGVPLNCHSGRPISSLSADTECIGDVFHRAGYNCAYIGKLHVDYPTPNDPEHPGQYVEKQDPVWDAYTPPARRHGFDYWYSYGTFDEHKRPHYWDTEGKRHEIRQWSPEHETDKVIAYLKNEGNVRNPDKPFFMMVGMNPPHSPYRSLEDCMEEDYNRYKDIPYESLLVRPNADPAMEKAASAPFYFASVTGVDRQFGRILKALEELKLDKQTIVIFASDHGETMCSQRTNDPKNSPYAESMNIPFLVRYPGRLVPRVDDLLLSSPDIMPTVLGLCGLHDSIPAEVQGQDWSPLFFDPAVKMKRPQGALYIRNLDGDRDEQGKVVNYFPVARGIKTAQYTLALFIDRETGKVAKTLFFDDQKDPYQLENLSLEAYPEVVEHLYRQMAVLLKEANDPWYRNRILSDRIPYNNL